ncbi:PQQ-dependent sugar dehydrogenase [Clostridium carnis]
MKRFIKFLGISIVTVTIAFGIFKLTNKYNLNIIHKNIDWSISVKGCEGAKSFDFDDNGNLYIAFKDTIRIVNSDGKDKVIIKENNFDILDIIYYNNKLYIATGSRIVEYNCQNNESKELISNIPNLGINKEINLLIENDILYFSVGSNTNSGIAEKKEAAYDLPTNSWILTGNNYGEGKTGPFVPYGNSVEKGEKVEVKKIGNAAVLSYDLNLNEVNLYSHGIRNIKGWDTDNEGNIKAIVGGMEDKEPRAVKDDKDYIYEIKKDTWYGWPDYSGGDPITSPRFSDGTKIDFLLENHPDKTPLAPSYQHKEGQSLMGLAIDKEGKIFEKNTIVFGDNKKNLLYSITKDGVVRELVDLGNNSYISKIRFYNNGFYVLDSSLGCLYELQSSNVGHLFNLPKVLWIFAIIFLIILLGCIVFKINNKKMKK